MQRQWAHSGSICPLRPGTRRRPATGETALVGVVAAVLLVIIVLSFADPSLGAPASAVDAASYYGLDPLDPYTGRPPWGAVGAFPYSPAFAQVIWPLGMLPWPLFVAAWSVLLLACTAWLTGGRFLLLGVVVAAPEIFGGNISLLLATAIVLGFRWPAAWSFVLLTKITPGIGLLWFVVRREWRALVIASAATLAIVAASFAIAPSAWPDWVGYLADNAATTPTGAVVPVGLGVRLPLAALLVIWGARTDRRWTVPVAAMLALPALWFGALAMLLAVIPLAIREKAEGR